MKYSINHNERIYLESLKTQMPFIIGDVLKNITKTSRFEESYTSRTLKKPVIIKKLKIFNENEFRLTFRQFLRIENGCIVYTPTPNNYINTMIDDTILKLQLFKSFVYKDFNTGAVVESAAFDTLKFDLILDIDVHHDSFRIKNLQIKSYYSLMCHDPKRFMIYIKDRKFANNFYFEIRYTEDGKIVKSSSLYQFIKTVESIWEYNLDFNNLNIAEMKATTEMLLI